MNMVYDKSVSVTLHYVEHECESKNECTFKYLLDNIEIIQSTCAHQPISFFSFVESAMSEQPERKIMKEEGSMKIIHLHPKFPWLKK